MLRIRSRRVLHLKLLISVVPSKSLVMVLALVFQWHFQWATTGLARILCLLILLLELVYLFLQIIRTHSQTSRRFASLAPFLSACRS